MYWEIKKKLCDSFYWDNHFVSVVWNQTRKISKICLYHYCSECEVVSHCWAFFFLAALGLYCCRGAFSSCGEWGLLSPQVGSSCSAQAGLVVEHRLQGARAQLPAACGIFPDQGFNGCPLHWRVDSSPLDHQGSPSLWFWFAFPKESDMTERLNWTELNWTE